MTNILPEKSENHEVESTVSHFFKEFKIGTLLNRANVKKTRGVSPVVLFQFLFTLVFTSKSGNQAILSSKAPEEISVYTVNRFMNAKTFNWRKFLILLSESIIVKRLLSLVESDSERVLIIDDSTYSRNRSKKVELLAKVYDHSTGTFMRGFRMLTLGWSDGISFIPLAHTLLSSEKKQARLMEANDQLDKRTVGYKRRVEAQQKATKALFDLLDSINPRTLQAKTVLFDSWFAYPKTIKQVVTDYPLQVICMLKPTRTTYGYNGQKYNLKDLYRVLKKKRGRAKIKASVVVSLGLNDNNEDIQAKIIFVRDNRRGKKNWLALLSTDVDLPDEEIIRLYGKRWQIETFFKYSKSYLKLSNEFSARDYDNMVAHTAVVFTRYMMFALISREEKDPRTIGELFYLCCDEMENIRFAQSLFLVMACLKETLMNELVLSEQHVQDLLDTIFDSLPELFKPFLKENQLNQISKAA
jgi:hypothetical protein